MVEDQSRVMIFFFNDTATTEIYTLSLHDALPICRAAAGPAALSQGMCSGSRVGSSTSVTSCSTCGVLRSEEHTSELQSRQYLVCRLLLEKNKTSRLFISSFVTLSLVSAYLAFLTA